MVPIRAIRLGSHPFPFLLVSEWALLAIALWSEFSPTLLRRSAGFPAAAQAIVLLFGVMGIWLPLRPQGVKIAHFILQVILILLAARWSTVGLRLFPLLQIVLVLRSSLMFHMLGRVLVTSGTFVVFLIMVQSQLQSLGRSLPPRANEVLLPQLSGIRLNLVVMFSLVLVFLLMLMNALIAERQRGEELKMVNQKLKESAAQIEILAMGRERSRIARDIHDSLGHALSGLNIQLEGALKLWEANPEQARNFVTQAKMMGSTALGEARQAVATLRQTDDLRKDLSSEIDLLIRRFVETTGILPQVAVDCPPLPESVNLTVYRIVQEGLTNISKYARADHVRITIQASSEPAQLAITIEDNGVGFHPHHNSTGFGLRGIRERAEAEGGQLRLITAPGEGSTLSVWFPLDRELT
ncbi:sensor histidine kinase [Synechococcus sp. BSF8S]|uniref:sensor histidine kinase n=1 Tax=Synechococcales TaxID=1890424 RepID=UPI0016241C6A|nr:MULTISPECIES: sensor histidine kinase [unclassified Synechococcus]MBC1262405.1 sensor histidine kinase [Synechococcus sp. BSF8S]MBC1265307.1 sensor histidine kinase [Synechococcus sp. BSA11S]